MRASCKACQSFEFVGICRRVSHPRGLELTEPLRLKAGKCCQPQPPCAVGCSCCTPWSGLPCGCWVVDSTCICWSTCTDGVQQHLLTLTTAHSGVYTALTHIHCTHGYCFIQAGLPSTAVATAQTCPNGGGYFHNSPRWSQLHHSRMLLPYPPSLQRIPETSTCLRQVCTVRATPSTHTPYVLHFT